MSYVGYVLPNVAFQGVRTASFNGTGSQTVFTLPAPASSAASIEVVVNNVQQSPYDGSYSVNGSTLTFSEAPSSGTNNIYVAYRDQTFMSTVPGDGSVTPAKLSGGRPFWNSNGHVSIGHESPTFFTGSGLSIYNADAARLKLGDSTSGVGNGDGLEIVYDGEAYIWNRENTAMLFGTNGTARMQIDASGRVTMPYQPAFIAVKSGNQIPNTTATTKVTYEDTELNDGGAYNTSTSRFTAPVAGKYLFIILFNPYNISNALYNVLLYKNGSAIRNLARGNMSSDSDLCLPSSVVLNLSANDYIEVYVQIADTAWGISGGGYWNSFSGYLLG